MNLHTSSTDLLREHVRNADFVTIKVEMSVGLMSVLRVKLLILWLFRLFTARGNKVLQSKWQIV